MPTMQTFLPYEDFDRTAQCIDNRRLGKQRVECKQILQAIFRGGAWTNHPAVAMWRGHGQTLLVYYSAIVREWRNRDFVHNMSIDLALIRDAARETARPPWLGDARFHLTHQKALLCKDYEHYSRYFDSDIIPEIAYYWPVTAGDTDGKEDKINPGS
jgi:hypothetical protein